MHVLESEKEFSGTTADGELPCCPHAIEDDHHWAMALDDILRPNYEH